RGNTAPMTSTMSLAARICSSLSGGMSPAMPQGWPNYLPFIKDIVDGPLAFAADGVVAAEFVALALGGADEHDIEVFLGEAAGVGPLEHLLLQIGQSQKETAAESVLLVLGSRADIVRACM